MLESILKHTVSTVADARRDPAAPLRVTLITPEWPGREHSGGVARYAFRLARELSREVALTVVTVAGNDSDLETVDVMRCKRDSGRFGRYYLLPFRLRKLVRASAPDVVHSFGDDWAIGHRWPLVRTFHGSALREARSSRGLRKVNHLILSVLEHVSAQRADIKIAVGADSQEEFHCDTAMPPVSRLRRSDARSPDPTVVFIGSFHGRKRGSLISNAVEELRSDTVLPIRLVVVGPEDDSANWPEDVDHRSGLSDQEVRELISTSWVLAAPSEYEGFGIPVYEALALGTPAITTHTPGSDFLSSQLDGAEGLIFTDEVGLKTSLRRVLERGPVDHDAIPARQVDPLLRLGSSERLVNELYPEARRRFRRAEARRVQ